jgi:hypothetical protein
VSTERPMLVINPGPHIVENLRNRVASLTAALDAAQQRIDDLERVFGSEADHLALAALGLSATQARMVHLLRTRDTVSGEQLEFAMYADTPDRMSELDPRAVMKVQVSHLRHQLRRLGVEFESFGWGKGNSGYRMSGPNKARLAKLLASGARLVVRGRPDRKYYKQATARGESRAMNG